MINVPMQVSLPIGLVATLQAKLAALRVLHAKEIEALEKRLRVEVVPERVAELHAKIRKAGTRLTIQHVFRAVLTAGMALDLSDAELYKRMSQDEIVAGRPGVKRGSRAA